MSYGLIQVAPPSTLPVQLEDLKPYIGVEGDEENRLLERLIRVAVHQVESDSGWALEVATYKLTLKRFPLRIYLPRPPLIDVLQIQYRDPADQLQTMSAQEYRWDAVAIPGYVVLQPGYYWPAISPYYGADKVQITYRAGHLGGTKEEGGSPERYRLAVLQMALWLYRHRGDDVPESQRPSGYRALLGPGISVDCYGGNY
jgi:uncharacterized phiE125 gp8 family phage protein